MGTVRKNRRPSLSTSTRARPAERLVKKSGVIHGNANGHPIHRNDYITRLQTSAGDGELLALVSTIATCSTGRNRLEPKSLMACSGLRNILSRLLFPAAEAALPSLPPDGMDVPPDGRIVLVEDLALDAPRFEGIFGSHSYIESLLREKQFFETGPSLDEHVILLDCMQKGITGNAVTNAK